MNEDFMPAPVPPPPPPPPVSSFDSELKRQREARADSIRQHKQTQYGMRAAAERISENTPGEPEPLPSAEEIAEIKKGLSTEQPDARPADLEGKGFNEQMELLAEQRRRRKRALREHRKTTDSVRSAKRSTRRF